MEAETDFIISIVVSGYDLRTLASLAAQDHDGGREGAVSDVALLCPMVPPMQLTLPPTLPSYLTGANMGTLGTEARATLGKLAAQKLTKEQQEAADYLGACLGLAEARLHRYLLKDGPMAAAIHAEGDAARRLAALYRARNPIK